MTAFDLNESKHTNRHAYIGDVNKERRYFEISSVNLTSNLGTYVPKVTSTRMILLSLRVEMKNGLRFRLKNNLMIKIKMSLRIKPKKYWLTD